MSFTINRESQSYRFLVNWDRKFQNLDELVTGEDVYANEDWRIKEVWDRIPRTFCDYYRLVLKYALNFTGIAVFVTFLICMFGSPVLLLLPNVKNVNNDWYQMGLVFGIVDIVLVAVAAFLFGLSKWVDYREAHPSNKPVVVKEPGFIKTAYKAWKNKFCPIITFDIETKKPEASEG